MGKQAEQERNVRLYFNTISIALTQQTLIYAYLHAPDTEFNKRPQHLPPSHLISRTADRHFHEQTVVMGLP